MATRPEIILRGGTVVDGSGRRPAFRGDVAIAGERIVAIEPALPAADDAREIRVDDLVVAPGFIDIHSHSDFTLLRDPRAVSQISQGVTTEIVGNCGYGCCPIRDAALAQEAIYGYDPSPPLTWRDLDGYFDRLQRARPAVNVAALVPNGQMRIAVLGMADRPARACEVERMAELLREGLDQGAAGYSTGLEYPWESAATEEEITALCRVVAEAGGLYATHTRNRDEAAVEAIDEAIRTARAAGARLQISHLTPRGGADDTARALDRVDLALGQGQDLAFDMHTRLFGTTGLKVLLPSWALAGGRDALARRLADPAERARMRGSRSLISAVGDWRRVVLYDAPSRPDLAGMTFAEIATRAEKDPFDCALDILRDELDALHRPMVLLTTYDEAVLRDTYAHRLCAVASDATALAPDGPLAGAVFHGAYTWASWFFRRMIRETGAFTLEEGIHRLTGLPAERVGLADRGVLEPGGRADIAVIDPARFGERGTTFDPNRLAKGLVHLLVNGAATIEDGRPTGRRAGRILRRWGGRATGVRVEA